jgi:hypothetical protein
MRGRAEMGAQSTQGGLRFPQCGVATAKLEPTGEEDIHSADSAFELEEFAAAAATGGRRQSRTRGHVACGLCDSARAGLHLRRRCPRGRISRSRTPGRIGVESRSQGAGSAVAPRGRCGRPHRLSAIIPRAQRTSPTPARRGGFGTERPRDTFRHDAARRAVINLRRERGGAGSRAIKPRSTGL